MSELDCAKNILLINNLDILCIGALVGGAFVTLFNWFQKYMETRFSISQKKLDIILGEAIIKMKIDLDDKITRLRKDK